MTPNEKSVDAKNIPIGQLLIQFTVAVISLLLAIRIVDAVYVDNVFSVILAVGLIQVVQWLLKPLFGLLTKIFGVVGLLLLGLFGNAVVLTLVFWILPTISVSSFWNGFLTAWIYAIIITLVNWIFLSQSDDVFLSSVIRSSKKSIKKPVKQGFLFLQLDGVSAPVLDWQLKAGNLPNIARLLKNDDYAFRSWHTQIPSTTPASQAGILFGNNDGIPAFRWYEKDSGQLVVANQTKGARLIEERLSNGHGLLSDAGVSIGNLFSGDASKNIMVMSRVEGDREALKSMREYSAYFYTPVHFMRSLVLSIGEMLKEIYQARRQEVLKIEPRIKRHGSYILLRAMTNVLLRDLQTTIVIQNMMQGVNSIYVDFLDYDEVAHHAGIARAESLASLSGLDKVVGILNQANKTLPMPYEIIIVSDHGQSQGPTFKQLHDGKTLQDFIAEFVGSSYEIESSTQPVEEQSAKSALKYQQNGNSTTGDSGQQEIPESADIVITGSGNLGNIWLNSYPKRANYEGLLTDHPDLINNLLSTKGIGLVLVDSKNGPLCISSTGTINLESGVITNDNPITQYPSFVQKALLRVTTMKNAPDIVVISEYNQATGEVYAFEELVGNHGGIGGWQTEAILLHPKRLEIAKSYETDGELVDSTTIHKILKHWLKQAGHSN